MNLNRTSRAGAFLLVACLVLLNQITPAMAWRGSERHEQVNTGAAGQEFDLASQTASLTAGHEMFASASAANINVGGQVRTVQPGDMLTAAEFVALRQVLSQGTQSLLLDAQGAANGGTFALNTIGSRHLASLVVPEGVVAVSQGLYNNMNVAGALSARGQILGDVNRSLTLRAGSVDVGIGGSISTVTTRPIDLNIYSLSNIVNAGSITASGTLNLSAAGSIVNALPQGVSGAAPIMSGALGTNLYVGSGQVTNAGLIDSQTGNVNISAAPNVDLVINNIGGQVSALQGALSLRDASYALKQFTGVDGGRLSASTINFYGGEGLVKVLADQIDGVVNLHAGMASINSNGGTLVTGDWTVTGDPTIANSGGDVVLLGSLSFKGEDLAILSSGNVRTLTSGLLVTISTCKDCTNSGNIWIVAGYDFTPATAGQVTNTTTTYTLDGPSTGGGSVNLPNFSLKTSGAKNDAGDVTVVAHRGDTNSGLVSVHSVDASAKSGTGGTVRLIGQDCVCLAQGINTTGLTGGDVDVLGEEPMITGGPITFLNGTKGGAGEFVGSGIPAPGVNGSQVMLGGGITTYAGRFNGGEVNVSADLEINIRDGISTFGGTSVTGNGGAVILSSFQSSVTVNGPIRSRGGDTVTSGVAPFGGLVSIFGASNILVNSSIITRGGSNLGTGEGGDGGGIILSTKENGQGTTPRPVFTGSIVVRGALDSRGGNTSGSIGGDGGDITTSSGTLQVFGTSAGGGASINASAGTGNGGSGTDGGIDVSTFGTQFVPTDFNLISMSETQLAIPGGLFNVGNPNVNGTKGTIVSGADIASSANAANVLDPGFETGDVDINVTNSSFTIVEGGAPVLISVLLAPGVRRMVTPGEALALFQVSRDSSATAQQIGLNADGQVTDIAPEAPFEGSNITIPSYEIFSPFMSFNISTVGVNDVTVNIEGPATALTLPSNTPTFINGILSFTTSESTNSINFGKSPMFVGETGSILATSDSSLTLFGEGGTAAWANNGVLEAGELFINTRKALTFEMLPTGSIGSSTAGGVTIFNVGGNLLVFGGAYTNTTIGASVPNTSTITLTTSALSDGQLGDFTAGKAISLSIGGDAIFVNGAAVFGRTIDVISTGDMQFGTAVGAGLSFTTSNGDLTLTSEGMLTELAAGSTFTVNGPNSSILISAEDTITFGETTSFFAPGTKGNIGIDALGGDLNLGGGNVLSAGQDIFVVAEGVDGAFTLGSVAGTSNDFTAGRDLIMGAFDDAVVNGGGLSLGLFTAVKGSMEIVGFASLAVGDNTTLSANTDLGVGSFEGDVILGMANNYSAPGGELFVISGGALSIGEGSSFVAGSLKPTAPTTGVLKQSDIRTAGFVLVSSLGAMTIDSSALAPTTFVANGGDVAVDFADGDLTVGDNAAFTANGGNVILFTSDEASITGGMANSFLARAVGTKNRFTGGGIELGVGIVEPTIEFELANRPPVFTVTPAGLPDGATIFPGASRGLVKTTLTGGGSVTLNFLGTDSQIDVFGGVTLFEAEGATSEINIDSSTFRVDAPVSYQASDVQQNLELVVDTGDVDVADNSDSPIANAGL
jgi:hypothetical protein